MDFEKNYNGIKKLVKDDLDFLEKGIKETFIKKTPLDNELLSFLTAPSKRLRPVLGFLFLRSLFNDISIEQKNIFLAVELIHSATLIHDDVIDNAQKRRNQETLNVKFDNNIAVVVGDLLLSVAMEKIISTNSIEVLEICTSALKSTCMGEINQYFAKYKITGIDEYIKKSKDKTALLFEIGIVSSLCLNNKSKDMELKKAAKKFAQNFGIAFQIRDDLINLLNSDNLSNHDFESGIYTAPVIFAYQENKKILNEKNILEAIKNTRGIEKTKILMDNYFDNSILAIENIKNSIYKKGILELIELLRISV